MSDKISELKRAADILLDHVEKLKDSGDVAHCLSRVVSRYEVLVKTDKFDWQEWCSGGANLEEAIATREMVEEENPAKKFKVVLFLD